MIPWLPVLPWLPPHGCTAVFPSDAEIHCVHETQLSPLWGQWRSRLGPSWRDSEKSDGKSGTVVANCKKELTGFKSPLSTHWDLGRKEKKNGVVMISVRKMVQ